MRLTPVCCHSGCSTYTQLANIIYLQYFNQTTGTRTAATGRNTCSVSSNQLKHLFVISLLLLVLLSCEKDKIPAGYHVQMQVDGKKTTVAACGTSAYYAQFLKDTALFIGVQCGGHGIAFYLKGKITDGTYQLNDTNSVGYDYYDSNNRRLYTTTPTHTGSITISTVSYQNKPSLRGSFQFKAIDTATGKVLTITNGSFLLERHQY